MKDSTVSPSSDGFWFFACAIIQDKKTGCFLLHLRDESAPVSPGRWALFGGGSESGETPEDCIVRELKEEIGITIGASDLIRYRSYPSPRGTQRHVFLVSGVDESANIALNEGTAYEWVSIGDALQRDLTPGSRRDLEYLRTMGSESR